MAKIRDLRPHQDTAMTARGGTRLSLLLALLITAVLIVGAVRVIPVYVRSYEFKDAIRAEARFAGVSRKSPDAIREQLYRKARALDLPVERKQIQVAVAPAGVRIVARYAVPVDLFIYEMDVSFDFTADTATTY